MVSKKVAFLVKKRSVKTEAMKES